MSEPANAHPSVIGSRLLASGCWLMTVICAMLVRPVFSSQPPAKSNAEIPAIVNLKKLTIEELIDKLQGETEQGVKYRTEPLAWDILGDDFMGLDQKPPFYLWNLNSKRPQAAPVVWELVRRGVQSLPGLLDHLEDRRLTKAVVTSKEFARRASGNAESKVKGLSGRSAIFQILAAALDHRNGVEGDHDGGWRYRMKVGDLCYVAIGQIVNRNLQPVRGGPFEMFTVTSPVQIPDLARACRRQWGGMTKEKHKDSLANDCLDPHYVSGPVSGMTRLYFYYPEEGEKRIIEHLKKKAYKEIPVSTFVYNDLIQMSDSERARIKPACAMIDKIDELTNKAIEYYLQKQLISPMTALFIRKTSKEFRLACCNGIFALGLSIPPNEVVTSLLEEFESSHGKEIAKLVPCEMGMRLAIGQAFPSSWDSLAYQYKTKIVLKMAFPKYSPYKHEFINCASRRHRFQFLLDLPDFLNKNIDKAVFEQFREAAASGSEEDDIFATVCIRHLAGKGYDAELRDYLARAVLLRKKETRPVPKWEMDLFQGLLQEVSK